MANKSIGYFDRKGHFFKSAHDATISDLAAVLGQISDGESLAPGIAKMMLARRAEIEKLFAEHDAMLVNETAGAGMPCLSNSNVAKLPRRPGG